MKQLPFSQTGATVSELGLGLVSYGTRIPDPIAFRLMDQFTAVGGTFFDTANMYAHWMTGGPDEGGGESESFLGRWLRTGQNRADYFIATKVGQAYPGVPAGLRAQTIIEECEKSLKRLGTDWIDLYISHADDRETPQEETMEAYHRLIQSGKVRFIGASNLRAWRVAAAEEIAKANGWTPYHCIEQRYSYLQPHEGADFDFLFFAGEELFDYARSKGMSIIAYSPLIGGAYTRADKPLPPQYVSERNQVRLQRLKEVASENGHTPTQIVYRWLLQQNPPVLPLMSPSSEEQMTENLGSVGWALTNAQMDHLTKIG